MRCLHDLKRRRQKPPPYYTEQTLLDDMCSAHKFAQNEQDRAILKSVAGIGTARTRGNIIEGLVSRGFIDRKKVGKSHQLRITTEGRAILACLPREMKDVGMTAKWERALGMVAEGKASGDQLRQKVCDVLKEMVPKLAKENH